MNAVVHTWKEFVVQIASGEGGVDEERYAGARKVSLGKL
jgi:hypothetical protein